MGEILLADEPTGALDSQTGEEVIGILKQLHSQGHTIIVVTHDLKVAEHAGRVIELRTAKIIADRSAFAPIRGRQQDPVFPRDNQHQTSTTTCDNVREALYTH